MVGNFNMSNNDKKYSELDEEELGNFTFNMEGLVGNAAIDH